MTETLLSAKRSFLPSKQRTKRPNGFAYLRSEPYTAILKTPAFARLKDISFLGALNYTFGTRLLKKDCTRAAHSLNVAALANYLATERDYCEDLKCHVVVAALLHDIGHLPLSHSVENYTKTVLGRTHHQLGVEILQGEVPEFQSLSKLLSRYVNIQCVIDLIEGRIDREGADLFANPINIDTIDGMLRTSAYFGDVPRDIFQQSLRLAKAAFLKPKSSSAVCRELDSFWALKNRVYEKRIHNRMALLSDLVGSQYFIAMLGEMNHQDLLSTEGVWRWKYSGLFDALRLVKYDGGMPAWLNECVVHFNRRKYWVDPEASGNHRYALSKELVRISLRP
jgi:putative nucleotidyltransferase with HDIG domain